MQIKIDLFMEYIVLFIDYNGLDWYYDTCKGDFQPTDRKQFAMRFPDFKRAQKAAQEIINSSLGDIFTEYKILNAE